MNAWNHLILHREEIAWAVGLAMVFAILFAVIVDILGIGSQTRDAIRHLKNRLAERSVTRLVIRIRQLQDYQKRLAEPRWLYLTAFQLVFLVLLAVSLGSACLVMTLTRPFRAHPEIVELLILLSLYCFASSGGIAISGFRHAWRDTHETVQAAIGKIGIEIESLQAKLRALSARDKA